MDSVKTESLLFKKVNKKNHTRTLLYQDSLPNNVLQINCNVWNLLKPMVFVTNCKGDIHPGDPDLMFVICRPCVAGLFHKQHFISTQIMNFLKIFEMLLNS